MTSSFAVEPMPQPDTAKNRLSPDEVRLFHEQGYLGPYQLCSSNEMEGIRARVEEEIYDASERSAEGANLNGVLGGHHRSTHPLQGQSRHLDNRTVYELCAHAAIVDRIHSLMGPDLILWRSNFFNKEPGGAEIPWHQDLNYWPIEPVINISAWLALDEATVENSCVRLIPGSHKKVIPHVTARNGMAFQKMAAPDGFDATNAVAMELKPGEFFIFSEKLLHQSEPNRSGKRRLGLAVRITVPWVRVDSSKIFVGHHCILLRGEDPFGFNKMGPAPA